MARIYKGPESESRDFQANLREAVGKAEELRGNVSQGMEEPLKAQGDEVKLDDGRIDGM